MSLCLSKTQFIRAAGCALYCRKTPTKQTMNFFNCNEDKVSAQQKLLQP